MLNAVNLRELQLGNHSSPFWVIHQDTGDKQTLLHSVLRSYFLFLSHLMQEVQVLQHGPPRLQLCWEVRRLWKQGKAGVASTVSRAPKSIPAQAGAFIPPFKHSELLVGCSFGLTSESAIPPLPQVSPTSLWTSSPSSTSKCCSWRRSLKPPLPFSSAWSGCAAMPSMWRWCSLSWGCF